MLRRFLGIDCGSVSLNLFLINDGSFEPITLYLRTRGQPLQAFLDAVKRMMRVCGGDIPLAGVLVTGSARELLSRTMEIPAINEISAHALGAHKINPEIRTIIEIGGQDSKYIKIEPSSDNGMPRVRLFRMNEICAAGTGAFLDEQAQRLGIGIESFGSIALQSNNPASIAGRCAVFAKTDMIHKAQEGTPLPDILLGLANALVRNYMSTLIKGDSPESVISLQGGVMSNQAVVHAFRKALGLSPDKLVVPPYFKVLGALGCAELAFRRGVRHDLSFGKLKMMAERAIKKPAERSFAKPLERVGVDAPACKVVGPVPETLRSPMIMGLDVGSVSVKGVIIDSCGKIVSEDYRLSQSRPLETVAEVLKALLGCGISPEVISVTGSGRNLVGRLLDADVIVNEITAQARAALYFDSSVDTVVEIGGQDSKWIALQDGRIKDFEMNRVCAAGTGSFLMAQAQRLNMKMGMEFSEAAFAADKPADLGNRCTVFMESDLIHHQNNGASSNDLAAGVCISIVQNFLERVANHKELGLNTVFLGGVAATPAVCAAFKQYTGRKIQVPPFFRVSGAMGAALNALDKVTLKEIVPKSHERILQYSENLETDQFGCQGCANQCKINKYRIHERSIFEGGMCDRWESEEKDYRIRAGLNLFSFRTKLLESLAQSDSQAAIRWAMVRSPQFYEYFPFWQAFLNDLGVFLDVAPQTDRKQFEAGSQSLRVETCLPIKVMAGQIAKAVHLGAKTLFHPAILSEPPFENGDKPLGYCPYIQASTQFFKGIFDIGWIEPTVNSEIDPDAFRKEHIRLAMSLGFSHPRAEVAFSLGLERLKAFNTEIRRKGEEFLNGLGASEQALVVLGKPYHTSDPFLNMNLGNLFQRFDIRSLPGDLYPVVDEDFSPVTWKYHAKMIRVARNVSRDPRLFPVYIGFFGCGPDAFSIRHIREALGSKPLLTLEMDEHVSRAGMITRLEAFLDRIRHETQRIRLSNSYVLNKPVPQNLHTNELGQVTVAQRKPGQVGRAETLYLPYWGDHTYAFAAAAMSVGLDTRVLAPPDQETERLGRPHLVGGECHPYMLVLGDYLKLALTLPDASVSKSRFYMINPDACRLAQFPVYIDKVRQDLGLSLKVITDIERGVEEFRISKLDYQRMMLRLWEGLNAYDLLFSLFLQIRPRTKDQSKVDGVYVDCRNKLFEALKAGHVREGLEQVLHNLYIFPTDDDEPRPAIAVTGDYYTRVVPFANNDVYREIEANGGYIWAPPTLSDCFKLGALRDFVWSLLSGRSKAAARHGLFYTLMTALELNIRVSRTARQVIRGPMDIMGVGMWKTASNYADTKLPAGITAPIATTLKDLDAGADGVLNLMTLNCSYGTVVTAALIRALKARPEIPMLTLVYDGLKKTNEKTRIEAFMEQAHEHFRSRLDQKDSDSGFSSFWRRLRAS